MQQTSREMQGMASPLNGMSPSAGAAAAAVAAAAQISLQELHDGHRQQQIQNACLQVPASHFGHSAGGHDDFLDQMLCSLPSSWPDLGNPKSPWDLTSSSNPNGLAGKSPEDSAAEGLQYVPYDESVLLASQLRHHQISGGSSPAAKQPMLFQLNQHQQQQQQQQQQQMLLQGMGRSPVVAGGGDSGLLPLPLSLGSGGSADSHLLVDRSRDEVDPSFKSPNPTGGEGLYNGFGGSLQRAAEAATQQHFHHPQGPSIPAQNFGGSPAAGVGRSPAAASSGGGSAPPRQRVRARRGQATDPHSIAERLRRERIAERMKALQELVPNANKTDKASMLDEIIDYVKFLQLQVKVLSMSRLGGAAAVAPLVADMSLEGQGGRGGSNGAVGNDSLTVTEHQVAKLMEEDMGLAMQYLQGKGLCLMPISLASAISATCHPRPVAGGVGAAGNGGAAHHLNPGLIPVPPPPNHSNAAPGTAGGGGDAPSSPSMSVLTVQSAIANGADNDVSRPFVKDAASISKP